MNPLPKRWLPAFLLAAGLPAFAVQPAGTLNVKTDGGAQGDGTTDDAAAIQGVLDAADAQNKDVYFPPGTYVIGSDITTRDGVALLGESDGLSIVRSAPGSVHYVGNQTWSDPSSNIEVEDLCFLNCYIDWYGSESVRRNLDIRRCLFFGNDPAFATTTSHSQFQVALGHVVDGFVEDCIFLLQSNCTAEAVSNPLSPALRSGPTAGSGATRQKQIPAQGRDAGHCEHIAAHALHSPAFRLNGASGSAGLATVPQLLTFS